MDNHGDDFDDAHIAIVPEISDPDLLPPSDKSRMSVKTGAHGGANGSAHSGAHGGAHDSAHDDGMYNYTNSDGIHTDVHSVQSRVTGGMAKNPAKKQSATTTNAPEKKTLWQSIVDNKITIIVVIVIVILLMVVAYFTLKYWSREPEMPGPPQSVAQQIMVQNPPPNRMQQNATSTQERHTGQPPASAVAGRQNAPVMIKHEDLLKNVPRENIKKMLARARAATAASSEMEMSKNTPLQGGSTVESAVGQRNTHTLSANSTAPTQDNHDNKHGGGHSDHSGGRSDHGGGRSDHESGRSDHGSGRSDHDSGRNNEHDDNDDGHDSGHDGHDSGHGSHDNGHDGHDSDQDDDIQPGNSHECHDSEDDHGDNRHNDDPDDQKPREDTSRNDPPTDVSSTVSPSDIRSSMSSQMAEGNGALWYSGRMGSPPSAPPQREGLCTAITGRGDYCRNKAIINGKCGMHRGK